MTNEFQSWIKSQSSLYTLIEIAKSVEKNFYQIFTFFSILFIHKKESVEREGGWPEIYNIGKSDFTDKSAAVEEMSTNLS